MFGSDTTSGFVRNRSSCSASGTTNTSLCWMAVEQNAMFREVSVAEIPTLALNHCRSSSTREISAMGVLHTYDARSVRSSNACSGSLSRIAYFCNASTRAPSLLDIMGTPICNLVRTSPIDWFHHTPSCRPPASTQQLLQQRPPFHVAEHIFPHQSDNQFVQHVALLLALRLVGFRFQARALLFQDCGVR